VTKSKEKRAWNKEKDREIGGWGEKEKRRGGETGKNWQLCLITDGLLIGLF
jgi:hypothetical protein